MEYIHEIQIVCSTDHNYVMPAGVMMHSASANNKYYSINFNVVIDDSVTQQDKQELQSVLTTDKHRMTFCLVDNKKILNFPHLADEGVHVTAATYYRLFLGDLLPNISKVLYLDCDMIVKGDLMQLYNTDMSDCPIAVVTDIEEGVKDYRRLGYPQAHGYFNAGMELINLDYWRANHCKEAFMHVIGQQSDRIVAHDQDVMNIVFHDNKKELPLVYNFQSNFLLKPEFLQLSYKKYKDEIEFAKYHAVIIHYVQQKPWNRNCLQADKMYFIKYRQDTLWREKCYNFKNICYRIRKMMGKLYRLITFNGKDVVEEPFLDRYYHL